MEEMQMSVVKAGADEVVTVIQDRGVGQAGGAHGRKLICKDDALPRHGERQGPGGALRRSARKHACGRDDVIDLGEFHVSLLTAGCSHLAEIVRRALEKLKVYVLGKVLTQITSNALCSLCATWGFAAGLPRTMP